MGLYNRQRMNIKTNIRTDEKVFKTRERAPIQKRPKGRESVPGWMAGSADPG
jgi:hypothetical protein